MSNQNLNAENRPDNNLTDTENREPLPSRLTPEEREQIANEARTSTGSRVGDDLLSVEAEKAKFIAEGGNPDEFESSNLSIQIKSDRILIQAVADENIESLIADLEELGVEDISSYGKVAAGFIEISKLSLLGNVSTLNFAQPAYRGFTRAGSVTTQGDIAQKSDEARTNFGVNGDGISVGIMSDSYNNLGGADSDVTSGDLPTSVQILTDLEEGGSDEGRAMAQIVHDIAPGAELLFRTAFAGAVDFANGIGELVVAGADVIVDDIGYLDQPFFQDGIIAQAASDASSSGVAYFSSAGNSGEFSYESGFNAGNTYTSGFFPGGFFGGVAHQFDGAGDELQEFVLESGERIRLSFQWNDPFATAGGSGATRDLDIYILNAQGTEVVASSANLNVGGDAVEIIEFVNDTEETTAYNIMIVHNTNVDGDQEHPTIIKYIDFETQAEYKEYTTDSPTVFGHPNATGVAGVGAANYLDTPEFGQNPPLVEDFSGLGGIPIYFDKDGELLETPEIREQPLFVAPDGGDTTFFGAEDTDNSGFPNFFGTSAAAPHAAAVAALMLESAGSGTSLTPQQIYDALTSTAIDMEGEGFDFKTGFGLINAEDAVFNVKPDITLNSDDDNKVVEGQSSEYTIVLNTQPSDDVTINFQVDTNKIAAIPSVTFTPDNWNTPQTITVTAEQVDGNDATIIIPNVAASSAEEYLNANLNDLIVDIIDSETAGVTIFNSNGSTNISEDGATDTYRIVLNTQPSSDVTINVAFDSTQLTTTETITFTPENWNIKQELTVTPQDDNIAEDAHTSEINFQVTPNSDSDYQNLIIDPLTVNITDNDFAGVSIELDETVDVTESGLIGTYQIKLNTQPTTDVTIDFTNDAQIELLNTNGDAINSVTFTPNNWDELQTVSVRAIDDDAEEGLHTSVINHVINSTSAAEYLDVVIDDTNVNIVDNETFGITILPQETLQVFEGDENGTTYKVIVNREPSDDVILNLQTNTELSLNSGDLIFTPDNWNQFQEVTVTAADDEIALGDRTSNIVYQITANSAPEYRNIEVAPVTVEIEDDDQIGLEIIPTNEKVEVSEDGQTGTYTVRLKSKPSANVFIEFVTDDQLEDIIPVTFTPDNWDREQTVTVTATDDDLVEDTPHLSVIKHFAREGSAAEYLNLSQTNISVEITDNDIPGIIIEETDGDTTVIKGKAIDNYFISLNSRPQSDVTININTDQTKIESISPITFTTQNWDIPQEITVIPVNNFSLEDTSTIITHEVDEDSDAAFIDAAISDVNVTILDDPTRGEFPNDGDNNQDGILDSNQSNVFSILILDGTPGNPDDVLTVVSPTGTILNTVKLVENPAPDLTNNPENNGIDFPIDFLELKVIKVAPGADAIVSLLLPNSKDDIDFNSYWIYQPTASNDRDHWESFIYNNGLGAKFFDVDNNGNSDVVLLHLKDGATGDADLTANGMISHLGGVGVVEGDVILTPNDRVFELNSATQKPVSLEFTRQSSNSEEITEVGVFVVDAENQVNGVTPTDDGFLDAALEAGTVIFSSLERDSNNELSGVELSRKLQYATGDRLAFYLIKNDTTDNLIQGGGNPDNVFFSITEANPDSLDHLRINDLGNQEYTLGWETSTAGLDLSFDDLVMNLKLADVDPQLNELIANSQGNEESELIDLTNVPAQNIKATFNVIRSEASFNNYGGLYRVEDAQGTVIDPITGETFTPGQSSYAKAAIRQSGQEGKGIYFSARSGGGISTTFEGDSLLAPFIIADGTPQEVLDEDQNNDPQVYFPFIQGNHDRIDHVMLLGDNTFGFEDLANGGDRDYDDLIFQVQFQVV